MKIVSIYKEDFEILNKFWREAGLSEMEKDDFERVLKFNSESCLKMVDEWDEIIGSVLGIFDGLRGSVYRLAIRPVYQRKKFGTKLMNEAEERLKKRGANKILLRVETKNLGVKEFYYKLGYKNMDYAVMLYKGTKV